MFIGICTRFGCATASCTCTDAPLSSGFGGILSNLKLARFLQQRFPFENTKRFQSPLSSAIRCEEGYEWRAPNTAVSVRRSELVDHVRANKSLSRTLSGSLSDSPSTAPIAETSFHF